MPANNRRYDDDDFDDRPRRSRADRQNEEDYDDRDRRRPVKRVSILGVLALIQGIGGLIVSLIPCVGAVGLIAGGIGLLLGIIGLVLAKKSDGEVGAGLPVAGIVVSVIGMAIGGIWLAIMGVAMSGAGNAGPVAVSTTTDGSADAPAFTLSAVDFDREYDTNEPAADAKYKGKWVEVTGKVKKVTGDTHPGKMTVELVGIPDSTVDCVFPNSQRTELGALKSGQEITVRGQCKGKVKTWLTLENCTRVTKGPTAKEKEKPADTGRAIKVTVAELAKAYDENVVAADAKYKGKVLEVVGEVVRVARTKPGKVTVQLQGADGTGAVDCDFAAKESAALEKVKPGQKLIVRGRCLGETDDTVTLDGCSLVK